MKEEGVDIRREFARHFGVEEVRVDGPLKVYQRDRLLGTVPCFPVRSTSMIFDVRPGDFTLADKDGEKVLNASGMIGPGDFACLEGWAPAKGVPDCYSDRGMADDFDNFAREARASAFAAAVEELKAKAGPGAIERSEAEGQRQMVSNFTTLPKEMDREAALAFGFEFGEDADELFVNVTPPAGWRLEPTEHSMWSEILDDHGKKRGSIFYKAAFYDRRAFGRWED